MQVLVFDDAAVNLLQEILTAIGGGGGDLTEVIDLLTAIKRATEAADVKLQQLLDASKAQLDQGVAMQAALDALVGTNDELVITNTQIATACETLIEQGVAANAALDAISGGIATTNQVLGDILVATRANKPPSLAPIEASLAAMEASLAAIVISDAAIEVSVAAIDVTTVATAASCASVALSNIANGVKLESIDRQTTASASSLAAIDAAQAALLTSSKQVAVNTQNTYNALIPIQSNTATTATRLALQDQIYNNAVSIANALSVLLGKQDSLILLATSIDADLEFQVQVYNSVVGIGEVMNRLLARQDQVYNLVAVNNLQNQALATALEFTQDMAGVPVGTSIGNILGYIGNTQQGMFSTIRNDGVVGNVMLTRVVT